MNSFEQMEAVIAQRRAEPQENSYTCYLFDKGLDKILKKVGEECAETIIAAKNGDKEELVGEIDERMRRHNGGRLQGNGRPRRQDRQSETVPCLRSQYVTEGKAYAQKRP